MPRPRIQKQLVPIPLTSGLSQREDPAHVQPGQAIQITNYVKGKQSTLEKPPGYAGLGLTPVAGANISYVAAVATHKSNPLVVATDTTYGPGVYAYSDKGDELTLVDRVSEVFVPTPQMVVAYQQSITEMDVAVLAPAGTPKYILHVWAFDPNSTGNYRVYYTVTDYSTRATIVPPQEVTPLVGVNTSAPLLAPKLTTCMTGGTTSTVLLTVGRSGTNALAGATFNPSTLAWGSMVTVTSTIQNPAVYDICPVEDDSGRAVLVYELSGSRNIWVQVLNTSTLGNVLGNNFTDTTWSGMSGNPHLTGFAVRASGASGAAWLAYAWSNGTGTSTTAFVRGGAQTYPTVTSGPFANSVDLTRGMTSTYPGPQLLDIKEVSLSSGIQQVVWSPPNTKVGYDPAYVATPVASHPPPLTAIYQSAFSPSAGNAVLEPNNPRWTNGVTLASRMYPYQLASNFGNSNTTDATQAFVVGFMPSNNLNPTWSGLATINAPNVANVHHVDYEPFVTFSGIAYSSGASGGAQGAPVLSDAVDSTFLTRSSWGSGYDNNGSTNVGIVSNIAISESGSGYLAAPTATLNWGAGSTLVPIFANVQTGGRLLSINPYGGANLTGHANQTISGPNVFLALNMPLGITGTVAGATITLSGAANANNNGTFAIVVDTGTNAGNGLDKGIQILNPLAVAENNISAVINNNGGGGFNYNQQPNTVPVYVYDNVNATVYTAIAEAIVGTSGANAGVVTGVKVLPGAAGIKFSGGGVSDTFNSNVQCWIPQGVYGSGALVFNPGPSFGGTTNTATSLGCIANVTTTLGKAPGYENIQGSFFLFSMDTFADFATTTNTGAPYVNAPMRLVATLKPRLGLNSIMSSAHTLPHWGQTWPSGKPPANWGDAIFDLPINVSHSSVGIMQFQPSIFPSWGINHQLYQGDELGGLTALAAGEPALTDGARVMEFAYPYYPENIYVYPPTAPVATGSGYLYGGSSYQYIATFERMDAGGNTHRSGRSVPAELVTLPTYDPSLWWTSTVVIPTMGFSPSHHGTNQVNYANVPAQPPAVIQLYRTASPNATDGGLSTTGGTIFYNLFPASNGVASNDLWSPYVVVTDGVASSSADGTIATNPLLYGDGSNGSDPGSILDNLTPPALQGIIVHKNRFWGFEGSNVWYTKAFTSGEGPGFNEQMAFSVDDGSGDITALASMDERLLIFKRDRLFYVVGDGPADNLSSNDLQPPQRIQSDVGAISQASVLVAPSGTFFLSDDGLYQVTRKFEVAHYGAFVDDWLTTYPVIVDSCVDRVNGRLVWLASKAKTSPANLTPGSILVMYSYLWDAWTVERFDEGSGNYTNFQSSAVAVTGSPPTVTLGGNYANTGGPFVIRESTTTGSVPNSSATATYQQSVWQSPWLKASDFQGFARWMLVSLSWYNSDTNQLKVQFDYNYSTQYTQTFSISQLAMSNTQTTGGPYPLVQWQGLPNFAKAESFRITITDMADTTFIPTNYKGSILLACTVTMGLKDGTKTFPVPVSQRGTA